MIEIKLPQLPTPLPTREHRSDYSAGDMQAYAIVAIEADRKRRGEPVGEVVRDTYGGYSHIKWKTGYKAGVGDKLYLAPQPTGSVAYLDLGMGGYMDLGTDLTDEQLASLPRGRHMLAIVGTYGVDGYTEADPQPAEPEPCFCDRTYPDSNPDASCGDCPTRDYKKTVEPVAWSILDKRTGKHWYTHDSEYTTQHYANVYSHRESDGTPSMVVKPLYDSPQIPEGYKLVPIEPTEEMINAALQDGIIVDGKPVWKHNIAFQAKWRYQQMLKVAGNCENYNK